MYRLLWSEDVESSGEKAIRTKKISELPRYFVAKKIPKPLAVRQNVTKLEFANFDLPHTDLQLS